jgi:hypothetical protein
MNSAAACLVREPLETVFAAIAGEAASPDRAVEHQPRPPAPAASQ